MRAEILFKVSEARDSVAEGIRLYLSGEHYREVDGEQLQFTRGSPWRRLFSLKVEDWPTRLAVVLVELGPSETGVLCRYHVQSGLHLVGTLDRVVLESETALLEGYLETGRRRSLSGAVAVVRRPVHVAVTINMILAVLIVVWVGRMAGYPSLWVGLAALAIAFLDGLVILAFADMILDGSRQVPRLRDRTDVSAVPPSSSLHPAAVPPSERSESP